MVRHYYGAPLPDYLYEKYSPLTPEGGKDFIRFENFLAGTSNEFIGRGAPKSATETHILHLKQLKNPVDFMRYVKGVVFPGKQFMIEKYGLGKVSSLQSAVRSEGEVGSSQWAVCSEGEVGSSQSSVCSKEKKNFKLQAGNWKLKYWWLWYPYRYYCGLRGLWLVITGTSTSSETKN
jgi:hypothetical protein